jgi:hypothetical protein
LDGQLGDPACLREEETVSEHDQGAGAPLRNRAEGSLDLARIGR